MGEVTCTTPLANVPNSLRVFHLSKYNKDCPLQPKKKQPTTSRFCKEKMIHTEKQMHLPMRECRNRRLIVRIRRVVKQQLWRIRYLLRWEGEDVDCNSISSVAEGENVMIEGYFSVLAMGSGEPKKFLVALNYLAYPPFVKLLEAAEQEFGFDQQGVLAVPCEASELQRILSGKVNHD